MVVPGIPHVPTTCRFGSQRLRQPRLKRWQFALADGSVHFSSNKVSPAVLKALSMPKGRAQEVRPEDWDVD
jgi:hypothetical protein